MRTASLTRSTPLGLAEHVRACVIGDLAVLLDLKHNRYHGVPSSQWCALFEGAAQDGQPNEGDDQRIPSAKLAEPLLRKGLLTTSPSRRRVPDAIAAPDMSIDAREALAGRAISPGQLLRFVAATSTAAIWLRFRSLYAIARSVEKHAGRRQASDSHRQQQLAVEIAAFDRLRPLAFTSRDQCLFDSLALTIYLAGRGVRVQWVIGVEVNPFKAHAWVQHGTEVLNDLHDRVKRFTPLLVV